MSFLMDLIVECLMISLFCLIWEFKSLRISLLILNCEWKKFYECSGMILRNEIDDFDVIWVCNLAVRAINDCDVICVVIWPWGPWSAEIPRPGGLESGDVTSPYWDWYWDWDWYWYWDWDGYLGREGGWCVHRLDMWGWDALLCCVSRCDSSLRVCGGVYLTYLLPW